MNSKDTSPEIAERYRRMLMARSGDERVQMGCDMLDAAIEMFFSTLPPGLPECERRAQLFLRFYGREFSEVERDRIAAQIRSG